MGPRYSLLVEPYLQEQNTHSELVFAENWISGVGRTQHTIFADSLGTCTWSSTTHSTVPTHIILMLICLVHDSGEASTSDGVSLVSTFKVFLCRLESTSQQFGK